MVKLVWCADKQGGLALNGKVPWQLPELEKCFDRETAGQIVVTAADALSWRPLLPQRTNVVIARGQRDIIPPNAVLYGSWPQVLRDFAEVCICVTGGTATLAAALPSAAELVVLTLNKTYACDDFFKPDLAGFKQVSEESASGFKIIRYRRADASVLDAKEAAADESFRLLFDNYTGPFDLLLTLIQEKRIDIMHLDLADLTNQYLTYIKEWATRTPIEQLSDYLVMATYLIELKSKRMVPDPDAPASDVNLSDDKERDRLIRRLIEYKHYREALPALEAMRLQRSALYAKEPDGWQTLLPANNEIPEAPLPEYVSPSRLSMALERVFMRERAKLLGAQKIVVQELSVEEVSNELQAILAAIGEQASLTRILNRIDRTRLNPMYFVTCFVALLVLARNGIIMLEQYARDEEIYVSLVPEEERRANEETPEQMVARQEALRAEAERLMIETRKQRAAEHFKRREEFLRKKLGTAYVSRAEYQKLSPAEREALKRRQQTVNEQAKVKDQEEKEE